MIWQPGAEVGSARMAGAARAAGVGGVLVFRAWQQRTAELSMEHKPCAAGWEWGTGSLQKVPETLFEKERNKRVFTGRNRPTHLVLVALKGAQPQLGARGAAQLHEVGALQGARQRLQPGRGRAGTEGEAGRE